MKELTALMERSRFCGELTAAAARATPERSSLAVLFLGLDRLKPVSDTYGHNQITESILLKNLEQPVNMLRSLNNLYIRVVIDDFGTGFSSLQYLKQVLINVLKIDRLFVRDITTDAGDATIVKAVIQLARAFNLQVITEGVETGKQLRLVNQYGCDLFQGFLHSRPLKTDALASVPSVPWPSSA